MKDLAKDSRELQRYPMQVPFSVSHLICTCTEKEQQDAWGRGKRSRPVENMPYLTRCNNCDKYRRYMLRRCENCHDLYINSFGHPSKCLHRSLCWAHVKEVEPCGHFDCIANVEQKLFEPPALDLTKNKVKTAAEIVFEDPDSFFDF